MADDTNKTGQTESKQANPTNSPIAAGDSISVGVGEGAKHVAAGKNIIQIGSLSIPRWAAFTIVAVMALVAVLVGVVAYFSQQTGASTQQAAAILAYTPTPAPTVTPVPTVTPTALPFAAAADGETMILILPFHSTGATDSEPHKKIWRRIQDLLTQNMPGKPVRAEIDPNTELTADQQAEAEVVGKRYDASMIIWGEDTGVELIASFLNLREPDFDAADVDIDETQRTQLANPSQYARFITRELPGQLAFLSLFALGQTYYLNNNYRTAIHMIKSAVAEVSLPNDQDSGDQATAISRGLADAYFRLGWLHQQIPDELDAVIADYNQAITLDPQYAKAYNNRGIAYRHKGELDRAIADYNQAITLDPQYGDAYNNRGTAYGDKGELDRAIADFTQAITLDPQYAKPYNNRGLAYYGKGELDQAITDYNQAITLDPQYASAYIDRGIVYYDQGEFDKAIADYDQAIALDPELAHAYTGRGIVYRHKGELDQALAFDEVMTYSADSAYNTYHDDNDELDQAIADFNQAITLDPKDASAYYNRGLAYYDMGEFDKAIADFNQAITLDPKDADAYSSLCWDLAVLQQAEKAMLYCEEATSLSDDPFYLNGRGLAHALLGDYPAAIADFQGFVDWLINDHPDYPDEARWIEQGRSWIEALKGGENPFTPEVLEELKQQ